MIHAGDVTYYPKAGMFKHGRMFCSARHRGYDVGFWREFFMLSPQMTIRTGVYVYNEDIPTWKKLKAVQAPGDPSYIPVCQTIGGITPVVHVWRIQRAVRRFLQSRFEQRTQALAMCFHERLGSASALACLTPDVLYDVLGL